MVKVVRLLLVDNYDSYTYNVYQMLREVKAVGGYDVQVDVVKNDAVSWSRLKRSLDQGLYQALVLSPGPGTPQCEGDIGICKDILKFCVNLPILGVCLGHQALAHTYGAKIVKAPEPFHGRLSKVQVKEEEEEEKKRVPADAEGEKGFGSCSLLKDISQLRKTKEFEVVRYHSLVVDEKTLPDCVEALAWAHTDDEAHGNRLLMALRHKDYPHYGVQFHPESICTCHGDVIFKNFIQITIDYCMEKNRFECPLSTGDAHKKNPLVDTATTLLRHRQSNFANLRLHKSARRMVTNACVIRSNRAIDTERLFLGCCCESNQDGQGFSYGDTFWLDSSNLDYSGARFSFMGKKGGSLWRKLKYQLGDSDEHLGTLTIEDGEGTAEDFRFLKESGMTFWDCFDDMVEKTRSCASKEEVHFIDPSKYASRISSKEFSASHSKSKQLPFDFQCGFVGFIGYEMKEQCGGARKHKSSYPDVFYFFEDRLIAVDHDESAVYLVEMCEEAMQTTSDWMNEVLVRLNSVGTDDEVEKELLDKGSGIDDKLAKWSRTREEYIRDIGTCKRYLLDGDSYEICLTNRLKIDKGVSDPLAFYSVLRQKNPAPYSAFFCFAQDSERSNNLSVCCSSPERFLKLTGDGTLEAKPIKGTIRRGMNPSDDHLALRTLEQSGKDRAENLMIVDLLRNDLGRVSKVGSVHVPKLMDIESFATVHQMVSTVRGAKADEVTPVGCIRAAFPAGSMTGAPKVRTMQIIDTLETEARGIYSGSIGYISSSSGAFDLNVVIRSAVMTSQGTMIGAGGAITIQSEAESEHDEIKVKAEVILDTVKAASQSRLRPRRK